MMKRPLGQFAMTVQFLADQLPGLPDDAEIIDIRYEPIRGLVYFLVRSDEYSDVPEGQEPLQVVPKFTRSENGKLEAL